MKNESAVLELRPLKPSKKIKGTIIQKDRMLIGKSHHCDLIINWPGVSAIHAVLEVRDSRVIIYDMNGPKGLFFEGQKVLSANLNLGDVVGIGEVEFRLVAYVQPPPKSVNAIQKKNRLEMEQNFSYPLAHKNQPIIEDHLLGEEDKLFPIFKYGKSAESVEILILYDEVIHIAEYLPLKNKQKYYLVGQHLDKANSNQVEFPHLAKGEKFLFVDTSIGEIVVLIPVGFDYFCLKDGEVILDDKEGTYQTTKLGLDDIVKFQRNNIQIFVRPTDTPPIVEPAPFFGRDWRFKKYMLIILVGLAIIIALLASYQIQEGVESEIIPDRTGTFIEN